MTHPRSPGRRRSRFWARRRRRRHGARAARSRRRRSCASRATTSWTQLLATLERDPARLAELRRAAGDLARPAAERADLVDRSRCRGWRTPARDAPGAAARKRRSTATASHAGRRQRRRHGRAAMPLKLYQPAHQRHYLVSAPPRVRRAGSARPRGRPRRREQVELRAAAPAAGRAARQRRCRRRARRCGTSTPSSKGTTAGGARRDPRRRRPADAGAGEELLPLFPLDFTQDDGHRRAGCSPGMRAGRPARGVHERAQARTRAGDPASARRSASRRPDAARSKLLRSRRCSSRGSRRAVEAR